MKNTMRLFWTMLKIGLFTFGGGYAMIALLENELVEKKRWMEQEEFVNMVAIAESTPGPIAINIATYVGYKTGKLPGALLATLGVCIPSFSIIYVISLFFDRFLAIGWVAAAFRGIQVCVIFLILSAGIKMLIKLKKTPFSMTVMALTICAMLAIDLFAINFSSIFLILISGALGLTVYAIGRLREGRGRE